MGTPAQSWLCAYTVVWSGRRIGVSSDPDTCATPCATCGRSDAPDAPGAFENAIDQVLSEQKRFRTALMELNDLAHKTEDDNDFYQRLLELAVEVVPGAQGGSVQLSSPSTDQFRFVAAVGYDLAALQRREIAIPHEFYRTVSNPTAQIVHHRDNPNHSPEVTEWLVTAGRLNEISSSVAGPVVSDGVPVAFLSLDNFEDPAAMTETSIEMTTVLSGLIGDLLRRRTLEAEIRTEREAFRQLALRDPLTGLANRRYLTQIVDDTVTAARRAAHPSCVVFIDLDDFKGINDRLGHEAGDNVLISVAEALSGVLRIGDAVGRWGGDEFLVLPRRLEDPDEALELASRILARFEDPLELADDSTYRVRLSVGVGWSPDSSVHPDKLVHLADQALYEAKSAGKGLARLRLAPN